MMPGGDGLAGDFCGQEGGSAEDEDAHAATLRR
jgi:hypothetical protein